MQKSFRKIRHQLQSKTWITVLESLIEDGVDFVVGGDDASSFNILDEALIGNVKTSGEHEPATSQQIKNFFKNHKSKSHPSGVKVKVEKIRSSKLKKFGKVFQRIQGDYFRVTVVNPGDTIPNVIRQLAMQKILGGTPSDWTDVNYGTIKSNMMTLGGYQWTALFKE